MRDKENNPRGSFFRDLLPALCLSLCMSFLAAVYAPLELFFTNLDEFKFSFWALLPQLVGFFFLLLAACLVVFLISRVIHRKLYHAVLLVALVGLICTYIQGVYMSGALPSLDGSSIPWDTYKPQHIASIVLWVVVIGLAVAATHFLRMPRMKTGAVAVSAFLTAIMLVTLVTVGIQYDGFSRKTSTVVSKAHAFDMSEEENFVIFVVDAVDSATFQTMMETTNPEFQEIFEDFTYYPDTVCGYPFTQRSVPLLLTGQWYEWQEDFRVYSTQAYDRSPLLNTLRERGYRMGIYEEEFYYDSQKIYEFENIVEGKCSFTSFWRLVKEESKLVWFKYAPYPLKDQVTIYMDQFNALLHNEDGAQPFQAKNTESYQDIRNASVNVSEEPCFRFIHVEGAHVPYRYDKNVNLIDSSQGSYEQNMEAAMTMVHTYLQKLKDAGVYDNTAIIVMADHGFNGNNGVAGIGRSNPFLAVKGKGERHPMEISDAPISYDDLQTAYRRLLDGASSDQVFDAQPGDQRQRRFILYWFDNDRSMWEYVQTGHASDFSTMIPTGVEASYDTGQTDPKPTDSGKGSNGQKDDKGQKGEKDEAPQNTP